MFEKGKRERRQSEEDKIFNRMLIWLAVAVVVELLLLLLRKAYVDIAFGGVLAMGLLTFFQVFSAAGAVLTAGGVAWTVFSRRAGKGLVLPLAVTGAAALLWVVSLISYFFYPEGVRVLLLLPAAAAVLIVIFFLYQRVFFYNAVLTGGGLMALWLYGRYYMYHPRMITACFVGGLVVLAASAALLFRLKKGDGKLGRLRVIPASSSNVDYMIGWATCAITALVMVLGLTLGMGATRYLMYVLAAWLFAQGVFFTVKMM
ncbi:MAG: hypothetical protein HDT38_02100 [Clostridiales bacterium]|nr:hypothetical protein [Clostridiales bacterium]